MIKKKTTPKKPADVIQFSPHKDARDNVGEIIQACRDISIGKLDELLRMMFERADDTLFDLGERAGSNVYQTQYFDSMRELRRQRKAAEQAFRAEIVRGFNQFAKRTPKPAKQKTSALDIKEKDLSLVDQEQYEESLAINNMVNKAQSLYLPALHALNKRFSVLQGGLPLEPEDNPAGPVRICAAFHVATEPFDLDVQARLVVYKLFDRFVISHLEGLYGALNKALIEAGVLPEIKTTLRRAPGRASGQDQATSRGQAESSHYLPADDAEYLPGASEQDRILDLIEDLLAFRHDSGSTSGDAVYHHYSHDHAPAGAADGREASPHNRSLQLLSALASLQTEVAEIPYGREAGNQVRIKELLTGKVRSLTSSPVGPTVSTQDEDTIDLVGMLFEFIIKDRNLPDPIQATLIRLQIPYLKIALTNRRFFVQRNHPARKLLDDMARAGIGWTPQNDKDNQLLGYIRDIVERILNEFDENVGLFEELSAQFDEFIEKHQRIARIAEKRTTEATQGRERLHQARKQAAWEITSRLKEHEPPRAVQRLLAQPWSNVLILTLLRQGEDSGEWREALMVADDLIWAVQPKHDEPARDRLRELILPLTEAIRNGLALVAIHEDEVERIQNELTDAFEAALNGQAADRVLDTSAAGSVVPIELPEWMAEFGDAQAPEPIKSDPRNKEYLQAALQLPVGTWMEFAAQGSSPQRAKLSWISPISQRYLFVNQKGLKVADRLPEVLAVGLRDGQVRILDDVPLLDRALDSIARKLRQDKSGAGESRGNITT